MQFKWTRYPIVLGFAISGFVISSLATAEVTRASDWLDRIVITSEGELLGRVEDLALNVDSNSLEYLVVSVGSYLVDENLIAVKPDAIDMGDDGVLTIPTDVLVNVPRFNNGAWPDEAQVYRSRPESSDEGGEGRMAQEETATAEIIGARKRLTVSGGQRSEESIAPPVISRPGIGIQPKVTRAGINDSTSAHPLFNQFDSDGDGYLSRQEIAPHFHPGLKFSDFDLDANGGLDGFEFEVLQERR